MLARIVGGVVMVVMLISLYTPMTEAVSQALISSENYNEPLSANQNIILKEFPKVYVLVGIFMVASMLFIPSANEYDEEYEDVEEEEKPHKQTYLEYVKEREGALRIMSRY